jgi:membrane protein YdbS with pleckstrin-like domain
MSFDEWNQRLAARLSPRQAGWTAIGILVMLGIGPYLMVGTWYEGLTGVWVMIQAVGVVAALAIFLLPWKAHQSAVENKELGGASPTVARTD